MKLSDQLEYLHLKLSNTQLQAQSLERDVIVLNYARLLGEANDLRQQINKLEEEIKQNEKSKMDNRSEPVGPGPDTA